MSLEKFLALVSNPGGTILGFTKAGVQLGEKAKPNRTEHFTSTAALIARAAALSAEGCDLYFTPATFNDRSRLAKNAKGATAVWVDVDVRDDKGFDTHAAALEGIYAFVSAASLPVPTIVSTGGGYHCYWVCDTAMRVPEWEIAAKSLHAQVKRMGGLIASDTARITDIASLMRLPGFTNNKRGSLASVHQLAPAIPHDEFKRLFSASHSLAATMTPGLPAAPGLVAPTLGVKPSYLGGSPATAPMSAPMSAPMPGSTPTLGAIPAYLRPKAATTMQAPGGLAPAAMPVMHNRNTQANPINTGIAKPDYAQVLTHCALLRDMAINPDTVSEPAWKMALNIIMRTEQGIAAAHEFSSGYAGYNPAETEEKAAAADEFGKPVTCSTLSGVHDRGYVCIGCPNHNRGVTPLRGAVAVIVVGTGNALQRAKATADAAHITESAPTKETPKGTVWGVIPLNPSNNMLDVNIVLPPPPQGYMFGHLAVGQSGVFASADLGKPLTSDLLWVDRMAEWINESGSRKVGYRMHHIGVDGAQNTTFLSGSDLDRRSMGAWLTETGVTANVTPELVDYVLHSCEAVRRAKVPPIYVVSSYGWYFLGGKRAFVSPTSVLTEDGMELDIMINGGGKTVIQVERPSNPSTEAWCSGYRVQFLEDDCHAHFFVLASMASALFKIAENDGRNVNGMMVIMSGTSGSGKTHVNAVCSSVWDRWSPTAGNSTFNALPKEAAAKRHIPAFLDDLALPLGDAAKNEARNAVLHYTLGKEKSRLDSASHLSVPATWRNIMFISTNEDVTAMMRGFDNGGAATARIVEVRMPNAPRVDTSASEMQAARTAVLSNYGVLGNEFVRRLLRMPEKDLMDKIEATFTHVSSLLLSAGVPPYKMSMLRVRHRLVSMCIVVADIMRDCLPYDMSATIEWAVNSLARGEFMTGLPSEVSHSHAAKIKATLHRTITSNQSSVFQYVLPHPDERKLVTISDVKELVKDPGQWMYNDVGQAVTPQEYARVHNTSLSQRNPSVDVIQSLDWCGHPAGFYVRYDYFNEGKRGSNGLSARAVLEALGTPADGCERVQRIPMDTITPGRLRGIAVKYIYLTPDEVNDLGDD